MNSVFDPVRQPRLHRDFENDGPKSSDLATRVFLASLSVGSLYRPFGRALSIGTNFSRVFFAGKDFDLSFEKTGNLALSVAAVAGGVFYSQIGMMITTSHDILINLREIFNEDPSKTFGHKALDGVKLLNNVAYITLLVLGSLEMQILSLAAQILLNLGTSIVEYGNDRYLEASVNLLLGGVRIGQIQGYVELWNRRRKIEEAIRNVFVGIMKEKWMFPSDHLPVGVEVDGEFKVISWNVMNNCYMEWVKEKDSQGLNGSLITQLDVQVNEQGLTQRDLLVIEMLKSMVDQTNSGLIALQECGEPFLQSLGEALPQNWHIARSFDPKVKDQEVVLYNQDYVSFDKQLSETPLDAYPSVMGRQLAQFVFRKAVDGKTIRLFNAHIPGDPGLPGPEEYASYVRRFFSGLDVILALGDCNFERDRMVSAFEQAGLLDERYPEQVLHTPWPTNIHPQTADFAPGPLNSKGIDHLLVLNATSRALKVEEVLEDARLSQTIKNLQNATEPLASFHFA